jgi:hypothetical protein
MRYLGLALFAEGTPDYRFLAPILRRVTEGLCLQLASDVVEIGEVLELHSPVQHRNRDRATRILEAAREACGAYGILFIHTDGAGDPDSALRERVEPAAQRIANELIREHQRTVAVVPIRETEAWALVDGDALRAAFGTVLDDSGLGIPGRPREVEGVLDPKQALNQAFANVIGTRRLKKKKAEAFLDAIGEWVQLARLREVPAFQRFERDLQAALLDLGYLSQETR